MTFTKAADVFKTFGVLGLTSFGGPTAHLGYFRTAFVEKRKWMSEDEYANTVALCQFLPGPASSQVGMAIGYRRAGFLGMLLAWIGFTIPSVIALVAFAYALVGTGASADQGWIKGLLAAAVAVVFHAVSGMAKSLANGKITATIAVLSGLAVLAMPTPWTHVAIIALAALLGTLFLKSEGGATHSISGNSVSRAVALASLLLFFVLLFALPLAVPFAQNNGWHQLEAFAAYFQSGALVFGGGHVVLPLLQQQTVEPGWVSQSEFLAGYSAAQAVPGPLFTFASYLGAVDSGLIGAAVATLGIFAPSALLVLAGLHFWDKLQSNTRAKSAMAGANAAVVGLLGAALYNPVFTHGITGVPSLAIAALAWLGMAKLGVPAWAIALVSTLLGAVLL